MAIVFPEGTQDYPPALHAQTRTGITGATSRSASVPTWATWIEVQIQDLSSPGTGNAGMCNVQMRNSGNVWVNSGYEYQSFTNGYIQSTYNGSTGAYFFGIPSAWTDTLHRINGVWRFSRMGPTESYWTVTWTLGNNSGYQNIYGGGAVSVSGGCSGISLFTNTNAWDRGEWALAYGV